MYRSYHTRYTVNILFAIMLSLLSVFTRYIFVDYRFSFRVIRIIFHLQEFFMKFSRNNLKRCLLRLNLDPTHIGYSQLIDCVSIQADRHFSNIGIVYSLVATKYGILPNSVVRNISYACNKIDDLDRRLSELLGFNISSNSLHNSRIISYLADFLSDPRLFDTSA